MAQGVDLVLGYVLDRLVFDPEWAVPAVDLSADFAEWLKERGQSVWSERTFVPRFRDHSTVKEHGVAEGRCRLGPTTSRTSSFIGHKPVAERFRGWRGVRFQTSADVLAGVGHEGHESLKGRHVGMHEPHQGVMSLVSRQASGTDESPF